uniref:BILF1 n=1 Tax=callitrichine gammaherpesvirus 3 TaxID=106331 RepID=A0A0A0RYD6_9GAMA|nr:BILF1 [callitrichine gammaherpesvirus 3]
MDETTQIMGSPTVELPEGPGCNSSYNTGLSIFTGVTMVTEILILIILLLFLLLIRKLKDSIDWWLAVMFMDTLLWLLGKLIQEFSNTGLCMLTQHMMLMSLLLSGFHHSGMAAHRALMVSAKTIKPVSNRCIIMYLVLTLITVFILVLASVFEAGISSNLNRGPNLCREGATQAGHAIRQAAKGFFFLCCCVATIIATCYITYKIWHTRLSTRMRIICNVMFTGIIGATCWLLLAAPLVFRPEPGNLGFFCPSSLMTRYYHAFGSLLILLLLLLYIWAHRQFIDDLKNILESTLVSFRRVSNPNS